VRICHGVPSSPDHTVLPRAGAPAQAGRVAALLRFGPTRYGPPPLRFRAVDGW
jgi:hypothetical protein